MAWSLIRIALFAASFLTGVFVAGSEDRPNRANVEVHQKVRDFVEVKCVDEHFSFTGPRPFTRTGATRM